MIFKFTSFLFFILTITVFAQAPKQVKVTGKVYEKDSKQPLEYATISLISTNDVSKITGGITNVKGEFNIDVQSGEYDIKVEFISFQSIEFKKRRINDNLNLGDIFLSEDAQSLQGVEIRAERSTVEIKLDKKVYNVGQDLMVKGGTISDVLDNVPSIAVDAEGSVSLRGNENVRILIDGKPSGLAGVNVTEALKMLPADAIDKVEVITNPSARYDAEGGAGIINIVLKKGKNQGTNAVLTLNTGIPDNHGASLNLNYKTKHVNLFTTQGYNYRNNPGSFQLDTEYISPVDPNKKFIDERRANDRVRKGYNGNFGVEWFLTPQTTWTNTFTYSSNKGKNFDDVTYFEYDINRILTGSRTRDNISDSNSENKEIATNLIHKFKKEDHQIVLDALYSDNIDYDFTNIFDSILADENNRNDQKQFRSFVGVDYVLPFGENQRFEAGYRGDFSEITTDFLANIFNASTGNFEVNNNFTNIFEYKEYVNAFYTQYGNKFDKFSFLLGLRLEDSNIHVNQLTAGEFNNKRYTNLFPSAFFNYEINDTESATVSYSRRIQRPRGRFLNPFSNVSSNLNIFRGNPDLDPAMTHAIDIAYIKRWKKLTFNTSAYYNYTQDPFQFVRRNSGIVNEDETPILFTGPVNIGSNQRLGFEMTFNYSPFKWWRINTNFNFFQTKSEGEYSYVDASNVTRNIDLAADAFTWFSRINSKITLPGKVDWQTNFTYNAPENTAQGRVHGIAAMNLAFSKDILKDKATVAFNISDVFNSRRRIFDANIPNFINSFSNIQWRERQFTLSLTYRFNRAKNEKERQPRRQDEGGGGEFMG